MRHAIFVFFLAFLTASSVGCLAAYAAEAPAAPLTLEDCVGLALAQQQEVQAALLQVRETEGRLKQTRSASGPRADLDTSWTQYDWLPPNKERILGGGTTDIYSEVVLRQLLYSGGRTQGLINQAELDLLRSHERLRRARQAVAFKVAQAFYGLLEAQALLQVQDEAVRQVRAQLEIARKRYEVGTARQLDVLKAEVQLANVQQAQVAAANRVDLARMSLNLAMGRDPETPLAAAPPETPATEAETEQPAAEVIPSHPEWVQSQLALRRAEAGLRVARSLGLPEVDLRAAYNLEGGAFPPDIENWNVGVGVSLPLWDSGDRKGAMQQASARTEQSRVLQEALRQRIELDIKQAQVAIRDAQERMRVTALSVEQARQALAVEQERYRVGTGSSTEVIDAQVALTQAGANAVRAEYDHRVALAQLSYAQGRDPAAPERRLETGVVSGGAQ
jgi:outer membrane protein TolC